MTPEEKLKSLGFELKEQKPFHPAVAIGKITGNLLYLSGSTPPPVDGVPWNGRVGDVYTVEQGYEAAKQVAFMQLQAAWNVLGDLSRIKQTVKVLGQQVREHPAQFQFLSRERYGGVAAVRRAIAIELRLFTSELSVDLARLTASAETNWSSEDLEMAADLMVTAMLNAVMELLELDRRHAEDETVILERSERQLRLITLGMNVWRSG